MVDCPTCGEPVPVLAAKGALKVHGRAGLVSWRGKLVPLGGRERALVKEVLMRGSATWAELKNAYTWAELKDPTQPHSELSLNLLNVTLSNLRRKLREAGVTCELKNIRGWGVTVVEHGKSAPRGRSVHAVSHH